MRAIEHVFPVRTPCVPEHRVRFAGRIQPINLALSSLARPTPLMFSLTLLNAGGLARSNVRSIFNLTQKLAPLLQAAGAPPIHG